MTNQMSFRMVLILAAASVFALAGVANAQIGVQQKVDVTVLPDFTATGVWTLPVSLTTTNVFQFDDLSNFGATGLMNYHVKKVANDDGEITPLAGGAGTTIAYTMKTPGLQDTKSMKNLYLTYEMRSTLTSPVPLYEIWVAGGGYFHQPILTVNFPKGWKLISHWPAGLVKDQTLTIQYPTDTSYVSPALLLFVPETVPAGYSVVQSGKYTIIGTVKDVQKIQTAIAGMDFIDDLFRNSLGLEPLSSVVIYVADLSKANIGYEAVALAAKPDVVLYNTDILPTQSVQQIRSTLVHEIAHLVEMKQGLFLGSTYVAPWFAEGVAVFMENQARSFIYTNPLDQAVDDALGETHMFTSIELKQRETREFDYLFNGIADSSVNESYALSGVVLTNFFNKVGVSGMQKLFAALKEGNSSQIIAEHDSDVILGAMTKISGLTRDAIISPYKTSAQFETDVTSLVHPKADAATADAVVSLIKNRIHKYISDDGVFSSAPVSAASAGASSPVAAEITGSQVNSACLKLTRALAVGSRGSDVQALQGFLIANNHLATGLDSGYYGQLTMKAVQAWQKANGISPFGNVGPKTRAAFAVGC